MAIIVAVIVYDSTNKGHYNSPSKSLRSPAKSVENVIPENKKVDINHNIAKIGRRSSGFGFRRHPLSKKRRMHSGTDFAAPKGTPIRVTGYGKVKFIGYKGSYGKIVIVNHGSNVETRYAHMYKFKKGLKKGSIVRKKSVIGYVGSTGGSTGNHLHYEYRVYGKALNAFGRRPMPFAGKVKKGVTLKRLIVKGEASRRYIDDYNRGSDRCSYSNRKFIKISNMKVSTIKTKQSKEPCTRNRLHAVGWPQVIGSTLIECQRHMTFSSRRKYNLKLQDKIFVDCLTKSKRPEIYNYVVRGKGLQIAARGVAREWASIGSPIHCKIKKMRKFKTSTGKIKFVVVKDKKGNIVYRPWSRGGGCYNSGYGINHHSVSPAKTLKSLRLARHNYLVLRKRGINKMKAYAYAIGVKDY